MTLSERTELIMDQSGATQKELAKLSDMTQPQIHKIIEGTQSPNFKLLAALRKTNLLVSIIYN